MTKRMMHNIIAVIIMLCVVMFFRFYEPSTKKTDEQIETPISANENDFAQNKVKERYSIDPNTAEFDELMQAGFSRQQAFACIKYRKAGGVFRYRDDIVKLYTVTVDDFEKLKNYIDLPEKTAATKEQRQRQQKQEKWAKSESRQFEKNTYEKKYITKQDLNSIDSAGLVKIPFIGPFRAEKILDARKKWGGFYSMAQLKNLYSFDSTACANVEKHCYIDHTNIRQINLNTCTFKEIQNLPASSYYVAKNIFDYKKIVGVMQNVSELVENNIVEPEKFEILKHYLKTF